MTSHHVNQQDNARLIALVAAFDSTRDAWYTAIETWETDPTNETHADALHEAERSARDAADALATHVASWVRTGYRLHRPAPTHD